MSTDSEPDRFTAGKRRRWFVALEPIFESGPRGAKARGWDVEDVLVGAAILGDVTIDPSRTNQTPSDVTIDAYAVFRDVDVPAGANDHLEMSGGVWRGDLGNKVPAVTEDRRARTIFIRGRCLVGDVTAWVAPRDNEPN